MELEQRTLRDNVETQIALACAKGIWEGRYLDFKQDLDEHWGVQKLLKLLLAFANTPRARESYVIYGVTDKDRPVRHIGVESFCSREHIEQYIREYTDLREVVVDVDFTIEGKRTPFIAIPLQFEEGPHRLKRELRIGRRVLETSLVYIRNGSSIAVAGEREICRMEGDWTSWCLDGRYAKSLKQLDELIGKTFPDRLFTEDRGDHVRFAFRYLTDDRFGGARKVVLAHAYPGLQMISTAQVDNLRSDEITGQHERWLIGQAIEQSARSACEMSGVRFISVNDIYSGNDVFTRYCNAYLRWWEEEKSKALIGPVVDLDFKIPGEPQPRGSVLSWLENGLNDERGQPTVLLAGC
jgi:hypothetical protein